MIQFTNQFNKIGINIFGIASGDPWRDIFPACRSVIVFGSGGPTLWNSFLQELKPQSLPTMGSSHPLDGYVQKKLAEIDPHPPKSRLWVRCAADEKTFVDFRILGHQAGLGWSSQLGILINRTYGLWFGLRLACFTSELITPTGPLQKPGPCDSCDYNCIAKCPGDAISVSKGWDLNRCISFQNKRTVCEKGCPSRLACPEGREHTYSEFEQNYHHQQSKRPILLNKFLKDLRINLNPTS